MDSSLDELIKSKRSASRGGRRGAGRPPGRGANKRGNVSGGGPGRPYHPDVRIGVAYGGGGPIRSIRHPTMARHSGQPYSQNLSKGDVNASWTHDLYDGPKRQIKELFDEFGPLKTATVHYDRSGRSLGTADVVFDSKNAALKAVRQYNNVPLDGCPMKIELATDLSTVANLATRLSRPAPYSVRGSRGSARGNRGNTRGRGSTRGNSRGRGGRGSRGGRGGRNSDKKVPDKDELDAQLDSFIKSNK